MVGPSFKPNLWGRPPALHPPPPVQKKKIPICLLENDPREYEQDKLASSPHSSNKNDNSTNTLEIGSHQLPSLSEQ